MGISLIRVHDARMHDARMPAFVLALLRLSTYLASNPSDQSNPVMICHGLRVEPGQRSLANAHRGDGRAPTHALLTAH